MVLIPKIVSFDAEIETVRVGFLGIYKKSENLNIYWYDLKDNTITASYSREFNSSVWIRDAVNYDIFAQTYTVISGGWYGIEKGGRWNAFKKTDGDITFEGVLNFNQDKYSKSIEAIFTIKKRCFSNLIGIEINNETVGHLTFVCKKITFAPSNKIYLHHRQENKYINASDILEHGGLGLKEFNLTN